MSNWRNNDSNYRPSEKSGGSENQQDPRDYYNNQRRQRPPRRNNNNYNREENDGWTPARRNNNYRNNNRNSGYNQQDRNQPDRNQRPPYNRNRDQYRDQNDRISLNRNQTKNTSQELKAEDFPTLQPQQPTQEPKNESPANKWAALVKSTPKEQKPQSTNTNNKQQRVKNWTRERNNDPIPTPVDISAHLANIRDRNRGINPKVQSEGNFQYWDRMYANLEEQDFDDEESDYSETS